jgi:SAM-dependent methyltransferase
MSIDYEHTRNRHTVEGAAVAFPYVREYLPPLARSVVDVGCGTGVWLSAARANGFVDIVGIDGVIAPIDQLVIPRQHVLQRDLTAGLDIGRRFDVAICLEVAEHLDEQFAATLIDSLVNLADTVVFSAACPGQNGQHHVNCQWPAYWQSLFNSRGYACDDAVRWAIWDVTIVEPWYRQNMFIATRDPERAGSEQRIPAVLHPVMFQPPAEVLRVQEERIASGGMKLAWYLTVTSRAVAAKIVRRLTASHPHE